MKLDDKLVQAAIDFIKSRFGNEHWAGAAAMYTEDGQILISTAPETLNSSVELCHETGAICEAHKLNKRISASVCVSADEKGRFIILSPCGVCQERLFFWGPNVEAAVPDESDGTKWRTKTLAQIQPFYWRNILDKTE